MCRYGRRFGAAVLLALAGGWAAAAAPTLHRSSARRRTARGREGPEVREFEEGRESLEKAIEVLPEFPPPTWGSATSR